MLHLIKKWFGSKSLTADSKNTDLYRLLRMNRRVFSVRK